jgi:hypothetical protein
MATVKIRRVRAARSSYRVLVSVKPKTVNEYVVLISRAEAVELIAALAGVLAEPLSEWETEQLRVAK